MSPWKRSLRNVPAPLPLSYQWWNFRPWCLSRVLEVELAGRRVVEARERRARTEEGRDPDVGEATVGRAGRVRVERAARDLAAQVAVERALLAGEDGRAVVLRSSRRRPGSGRRSSGTCRDPGAGACTSRRGCLCTVKVRFSVSTAHALPHEPWSSVTTSYGPNLPCLPWPCACAFTVAGVGEAGRREGEGGHEETRQNPALLHLSLPPVFRRLQREDP